LRSALQEKILFFGQLPFSATEEQLHSFLDRKSFYNFKVTPNGPTLETAASPRRLAQPY
jgi:hypothetical protein